MVIIKNRIIFSKVVNGYPDLGYYCWENNAFLFVCYPLIFLKNFCFQFVLEFITKQNKNTKAMSKPNKWKFHI